MNFGIGQTLTVTGGAPGDTGEQWGDTMGFPKVHVGGPMIPVCGVIAKRVRLWFWAG